jgi:diacylglycerol O-acyltransferase/trehalose O-mycolyltransferase
MLTTIAPRTAVQNPSTRNGRSSWSQIHDVSSSMRALTTKVNSPSVRMNSGKVSTRTTGRMIALTSPKMTATPSSVRTRFPVVPGPTVMPPTSQAAAASAAALITNRIRIRTPRLLLDRHGPRAAEACHRGGNGRTRRRRRGRAAAALALLALGPTACAGPPARPARIVAVQALGPRVRDLTVDSPALARTAKVRLLLPRRFAAEPRRRWPVLWLLHGCCDTYQAWTRSTDVEELAGLADVLVVMPEAGPVGFYSDWYNHGRGGPPRWETFHLTELRRLLERDWRAGDRRVVAGVSLGGLGAIGYAARHPGMFRAAAAYSGVLDLGYRGGPIPGAPFVQSLLRAFHEDPLGPWGDPQRQAGVWSAHDPTALASRLRGVGLFVSAGDGRPGPLDGPAAPAQAARLERALYPQSLAFVARLRQLGIPVRFDDYGAGTHDWPYWQRELHRSLPLLLGALRA